MMSKMSDPKPRMCAPSADGELAIPLELALDQNLHPSSLGLLIHLLACTLCHTTGDLIEHGVATRAQARNATEELTRHRYYRSGNERTRTGDTLKMVQVAARPGAFKSKVCVSRVYFAARADLIKIGTTTQLRARLRQLSYDGGPVTLLADLAGGPALEEELHRRFARYRVHGEWFEDRKPLRDFIAGLA
jgi:hypothetical protein